MKLLLTVLLASSFVCAQRLSNQQPSSDPDHALLMEKLNEIQRDKGWGRPETIGTFLFGFGGWVLAIYTLNANRNSERRKQQLEHLFDSLRWFEGDTQKRSIGIAIVEANQKKFRAEMGKVWNGVLALQAIHILTKSKASNETEHSNLQRILHLLTGEALTDDQRQDLCKALKSDPQRAAGLDVSDEFRSKWLGKFSCPKEKAVFP